MLRSTSLLLYRFVCVRVVFLSQSKLEKTILLAYHIDIFTNFNEGHANNVHVKDVDILIVLQTVLDNSIDNSTLVTTSLLYYKMRL